MYDSMQSESRGAVFCRHGHSGSLEVVMPIYEYKCNNCDEKFEVFVFSFADTGIVCAKCGSENTERLISSFASNTGSGSSGSSCKSTGRFS